MRLAVLCHGHPAYAPGGGENAAYALYQAWAAQPGEAASFWAAAPVGMLEPHEQVRALEGREEYLLQPSDDHLLFNARVDLSEQGELATALQAWNPDVIHAHHFIRLGLEVFWAIRQWLPQVPVVCTLHDFLALCPLDGYLVRRGGSLCLGPERLACARCMAGVQALQLQLRAGLMREWVQLVDGFVSPSRQLAEVVAAAGLIPSHRITVVENLLPLSCSRSAEATSEEAFPPVVRLGFFGNLMPIKGLDLVLKAVLLARHQGSAVELRVFGGFVLMNQAQTPEQQRFHAVVNELLAELSDCVRLHGPYRQHEIPELMQRVAWVVMGSRWRENAPVVIEEALACRRPLLVPGLGGMAEKVRDGLDGFHYAPGSATALADQITACTAGPAIWGRLRHTMRKPTSSPDVIDAHRTLYRRVVSTRI